MMLFHDSHRLGKRDRRDKRHRRDRRQKFQHLGTLCPLGPLRRGYIFLISVLVIGAIASTTAISLVLLGLAAEQSGLTVVQSAQAYELAQTCAERAIRSLRLDPTYVGDEMFSLHGGTCEIMAIGGAGNDHRALCVGGVNGKATRRMEIMIRELFPSVRIASWEEVDQFTLCP